jgi:hypothetical protein
MEPSRLHWFRLGRLCLARLHLGLLPPSSKFSLFAKPWACLTTLQETKGRTFHELDVLFAKNIPARQFATTNVDAFDEAENNRLAERYSIAGQPPARPSFVPSITNVLASHGHAEDAAAQRRSSVAGIDNTRRPSIAPAVTEYLKTH